MAFPKAVLGAGCDNMHSRLRRRLRAALQGRASRAPASAAAARGRLPRLGGALARRPAGSAPGCIVR